MTTTTRTPRTSPRVDRNPRHQARAATIDRKRARQLKYAANGRPIGARP